MFLLQNIFSLHEIARKEKRNTFLSASMRFELPALKIRPLAREMERGKYACEFRVSSQNLASVFACIGIINPFNRNWVRNRDSAPSLARLMAAANVQGEQKRSSHHPNRIHPHPTNSKLRTPSIKRNSGR